MKVLAGYIYAYKAACIRIEAESAGTAASAGAYLAAIFQISFFYEARDNFCCSRNADSQMIAEIGYAAGSVFDTKLYYTPLFVSHNLNSLLCFKRKFNKK